MEQTTRHDHPLRHACELRPLLLAVLAAATAAGVMPNRAAAQAYSATTLTVQVRSSATTWGTIVQTAQESAPIPGASITLRNLDRPSTAPPVSAVTDALGIATFTVETDSDYRIEASHASFHTGRISVHVGRGPQSAELRLLPADMRLSVSIRIQVLEPAIATWSLLKVTMKHYFLS